MTLPSVNPSGRVQRIASPIASPGQCGMCGKASHEKGFADARLDFEFFGTLIFCADCAGDLSSVFGYVSPEDLVAMREMIDAQNDELNTLRQAVLGLESAVDGLSSYNASRERLRDHGRSNSKPADDEVEPEKPEVAEPVEQNPDGISPEPVSDGAVANGTPDKLSGEQGRDDVRGPAKSDVSIDELLGL